MTLDIQLITFCSKAASRSALDRMTFVLTDPVLVFVSFSDFSKTDLVLSNVYGVVVPERDEVGDVTPEPPLDVIEDVEGLRPSKRLRRSLCIADERRTTGRNPRVLPGILTSSGVFNKSINE
jgi:hypothetical protein